MMVMATNVRVLTVLRYGFMVVMVMVMDMISTIPGTVSPRRTAKPRLHSDSLNAMAGDLVAQRRRERKQNIASNQTGQVTGQLTKRL